MLTVHSLLYNTLNLNDVRRLASMTVVIFSMMLALHLQPFLTSFYKTVLCKASHGSKPLAAFLTSAVSLVASCGESRGSRKCSLC